MKPKNLHKYRASKIVIDSNEVLDNGFVVTENGIIKETGSFNCKHDGDFTDIGEGAVIPSFINTHSHIELSCLKEKIPKELGFLKWVKKLIETRQQFSETDIHSGINLAMNELSDSGCRIIGDISNSVITGKCLNKDFMGTLFTEYLGTDTAIDPLLDKYQNLFTRSYAAHAPHTTSGSLIRKIKQKTHLLNGIFSIHVSESEDELEFIKTRKGSWADLLSERSIDFKDWEIGEKSPVQYLSELEVLDQKTIAVHLIHTDEQDLNILSENKVNICVCVRSNRFIHDQVPNLPGFLEKGINVSLGTDSLASCSTLNMFDEIKSLASEFHTISPEIIFDMATCNGAKALGLENSAGSINRGKTGKMFFIPFDSPLEGSVFDYILKFDFEGLNKNCINLN